MIILRFQISKVENEVALTFQNCSSFYIYNPFYELFLSHIYDSCAGITEKSTKKLIIFYQRYGNIFVEHRY